MDSVYLETTIPSYLTSWPAKNLVAAAHQAITREWWETRREKFELFTSQLVIVESRAGDASAAQMRIGALQGIPVLSLTDNVEWIAAELARLALVPPHAGADAFHIGYAAVHRMTFLLTWNCRHIANAERLPAIETFLATNGYHVPIVCTPEELMGDDVE